MVEIGPNLLEAVLAVVSLLVAVVAAWRAEMAHLSIARQEYHIEANTEKIKGLTEQVNGTTVSK
jgi:uncharacterized membrane protein YidH (DUF202 family)